MNVKAAPLKVATNLRNNQIVKSKTCQNNAGQKLSLKEIQAKEYPFIDSNFPAIFEEILALILLKLPEMKRLDEA